MCMFMSLVLVSPSFLLGFKSNYEDFKCKAPVSSMCPGVNLFVLAYIDYQARLQHLDDRDTLSRTCHKKLGALYRVHVSFQPRRP